MVKPCCCIKPQLGVKISSMIQFVGALIIITWNIYTMYSLNEKDYKTVTDGSGTSEDKFTAAKSAGIIMSIIWIVFSIIQSVLAIILWKASTQMCLNKSRAWLISTSVLLLIHLMLFLIVLFCIPTVSDSFSLDLWLIHIPYMILIGFLLCAVGEFIHEIKQKEERNNVVEGKTVDA